MDKRILVLVLAGITVGGLCAFKATRKYPPPSSVAPRSLAEPAPPFELYDQNKPSKLVRLIGYLGRRRVIVVFFDGTSGAHTSEVLQHLRDESSRLRKADVQVMAISTALPQENRKEIATCGEFPFPLLSDPDFHVHRVWGRFDEAKHRARPGVFLVDRKGSVAWSRDANAPMPLSDWKTAIGEVLAGEPDSKVAP